MSDSEQLSEALERLFADSQNGWFTPIIEAANGLTAQRAAQVPAEGFNSVWGG